MKHVWHRKPNNITVRIILKAIYNIECEVGASSPGLTMFLLNEILPQWNLSFCYEEILNLFEWFDFKCMSSVQEFNEKIVSPLYQKFITFSTSINHHHNMMNTIINENCGGREAVISLRDFFNTFRLMTVNFVSFFRKLLLCFNAVEITVLDSIKSASKL